MKLSKSERTAVMLVAAAAGAVAVSGLKLAKRHTAYIIRKAAAFFKDENEASADGQDEASAEGQDEASVEGQE